ncbi:MAG TPA: hypothetical protein VGT99_14030 [Gammaproteobacteria bacterium]|nr:hypothetical protein [Gammaproteobacteria bacterium]
MAKSHKTHVNKTPEALRALWAEGHFKDWRSQEMVAIELGNRGTNVPTNTLRMALSRSRYLVKQKKNGQFEYIQKRPAVSREIDAVETVLFSPELVRKLGNDFETEIADLHLNFGRSGNCTAFILRKILEKLIFIVFAKNGLLHKIEDKSAPGRVVGLEAMINTAVQEKRRDGKPFLTANTAKHIEGLKFLGDASAHNPLTEVDMKTILPQMPYIIMAYKELLS